MWVKDCFDEFVFMKYIIDGFSVGVDLFNLRCKVLVILFYEYDIFGLVCVFVFCVGKVF